MFKKYYLSKIKPQLVNMLDEIRHPDNDPQLTAFSMALGMFVAIIVPIGLQSATFIILIALLRFNLIIAVTVSLVTNPLTILPLYYAAIKIGEFLTGKIFPWNNFNDFIENPHWKSLFKFGWQGFVILFAGLALLTVVFTPLTYLLSFKITSYLRNRKKLNK